jgi:hypothetical protein
MRVAEGCDGVRAVSEDDAFVCAATYQTVCVFGEADRGDRRRVVVEALDELEVGFDIEDVK